MTLLIFILFTTLFTFAKEDSLKKSIEQLNNPNVLCPEKSAILNIIKLNEFNTKEILEKLLETNKFEVYKGFYNVVEIKGPRYSTTQNSPRKLSKQKERDLKNLRTALGKAMKKGIVILDFTFQCSGEGYMDQSICRSTIYYK